jgi:hypothetical protein
MAAVQNNSIAYSGLTLYASPNVGATAFQELNFGITGAEYILILNDGTTTVSVINTSSGTPTDFLYLRPTDTLGSTLGDRFITTNSSGNGILTFNVLKGSNTNFMLYYSPSQITHDNNDHTIDLALGVTLSPQPNGLLSVNTQVIQPQDKTSSIINLSGIKYDGFNVPDGSSAGIVVYQQLQGENIDAYDRGLTYSAGSKVINSTQYQTTIPGSTANIADNFLYFSIKTDSPTSEYPLDISGVTSNDWLRAMIPSGSSTGSTFPYNVGDVLTSINSYTPYSIGDVVRVSTDIPVLLNYNYVNNNYYAAKSSNQDQAPVSFLDQIQNNAWHELKGTSLGNPTLIDEYLPWSAVTGLTGIDKGQLIFTNDGSIDWYYSILVDGLDPSAVSAPPDDGTSTDDFLLLSGSVLPSAANPWLDGIPYLTSQCIINSVQRTYEDTALSASGGSVFGCLQPFILDNNNAFEAGPSKPWVEFNSFSGVTFNSDLFSSFEPTTNYGFGSLALNDVVYESPGSVVDANTIDSLAYQVKAGSTALPNDYPLGPTGVTSSKWQLYSSSGYSAITGTTSGDRTTIQGTTLGSITPFSNNNAFNTISGYTLAWDASLDNLYMIYYQGASGFTGPSYNFLSVSPFNLPLNNSPTIFRSSTAGVTANIYNINYNFGGVTSGQILVTDDQAGTTSIRNILKNPTSDLYYSPYFFAATGGTSIVEPGSYYQYVNPLDSDIVSGATFGIPGHVPLLQDQGITGQLVVSQYNRRQKIVLDLSQFNYFDKDRNSIFNSIDKIGNTGQIYIVSQNSGNTGTLYSGLTGIPSRGSTASITYNGPAYSVEFPDLGPTGLTSISYRMSFYDSTEQSLRTSNVIIPIQFTGILTTDEFLFANVEDNILTESNIYLKISDFDYFDENTDSIFGPSGVTSGTLSLLDGTTLGSVIGSTLYEYSLGSTYNYSISATGTFSSTGPIQTYLRFTSDGSTSYNTSYKSIIFNTTETFLGGIFQYRVTKTTLNFTLINFDYLDSSGLSIFNNQRYASNPRAGFIELCDKDGVVKESVAYVQGTSSYTFSTSGSGEFSKYFLRFNDSNANFVRSATKENFSTGIIEYTDDYADGGTAFGYTGPVDLQFPYLFSGFGGESTEIIVLGELTQPLAADQTIVMNVPKEELQRMIVYDSAWLGGQYGTGASGGGAFDGLSGSTAQTGSGFTGPNVGLFLHYVLSQVNVTYGFTGHNGTYQESDRLGGLDILFSGITLNNYQTLGNSGQTGNPWGVSGGTAGFFKDDLSPMPSNQLKKYMDDIGVPIAGASYSSESLLNFIPVEAIRSITQKGISIDRVSDIIQDVDTTMPVFVNPLRNLFEQSVAYGRANDTIEVDLADIPSAIVNRIAPNGTPINTPWTLASHIYGISFADNDTLTFYIKYSLGSARRYGIDPTVVAGLGPQWQNAPSIKLTFQGRSFDIPIGITDPQSGLIRDGGTGIGSDQDSEFADSNVDYTLGIQLIASPNKSNFDY